MIGCSLPLTQLALPSITNSSCSFPFPIAPIRAWQWHSISLHSGKASTLLCTHQVNSNGESSSSAPTSAAAQQEEEEEEEEESFQVLTTMKTEYNDIKIVDTPKSRMLILDSTNNLHSILYKETKWTGAYWDECASLPAIVPKGPIGIFGLGAGTSANLMLDLWPSLQLEGWEIDEILIDKARDYFGLSDLEKMTDDGSILNVHIGDVFVPSENLYRKYAGIVVDLFTDGKALPQLEEVSTWLELQDRLMPNGRFMVNCGGIDGGTSIVDGSDYLENLSDEGLWLQNPTLKALSKAFPGQLNWKRLPRENGANFMALTGPLPDLELWSASVPAPLSTYVKHWRPCTAVSRI